MIIGTVRPMLLVLVVLVVMIICTVRPMLVAMVVQMIMVVVVVVVMVMVVVVVMVMVMAERVRGAKHQGQEHATDEGLENGHGFMGKGVQ